MGLCWKGKGWSTQDRVDLAARKMDRERNSVEDLAVEGHLARSMVGIQRTVVLVEGSRRVVLGRRTGVAVAVEGVGRTTGGVALGIVGIAAAVTWRIQGAPHSLSWPL